MVDQAHINNLAVRPELRGRGLGTHLLESVLDEAARLGATHATLEVRRSNVAGQRLYERAGFELAGVRKNYYTKPVEDALILVGIGWLNASPMPARSAVFTWIGRFTRPRKGGGNDG